MVRRIVRQGVRHRGGPHWFFFCKVSVPSSSSPTGSRIISSGGGPFGSESEAQTAASKITDAIDMPEVVSLNVGTLAEAKKCHRFEESQKTGKLGIALQPIWSPKTVNKWKYGKNNEDTENTI